LIHAINAIARISPENGMFLQDVSEDLHVRLQKVYTASNKGVMDDEEIKAKQALEVPDIYSYVNLWLAVTCFGIRGASS
jgi:hypothetical protein